MLKHRKAYDVSMIFKAKYSMNKKIRIANANAVPLIYYSKFNSNFDHDLNKLLESFSPISKKISATQLCPLGGAAVNQEHKYKV